MKEVSILIISFFIYSVIGWIWETIVCSYHEKKFVYRGFLNGPYCPIYGFGALAFILFASPFSFSPIALFVAGVIIASALEYITSYVLEKSFNTKWWDYSDHKYNLNGRIALTPSLFWGLLSIVLIYYINKPIYGLSEQIYTIANFWPSLIIAAIMLGDFASTVVGLVGMKKLMQNLNTEIAKYKDELQWSIEDYREFIKDNRKKRLRFIERRTLKAFPKLLNINLPNFKQEKSVLLAADKSLKKTKKSTKK